MSGRLLITGADGYVGRRLAEHYLRATDLELELWVRAEDRDQLARKRAALPPAVADHPRVRWSGGDLRRDDAFCTVPTGDITAVVHSAAVTRFNVDADTARSVNVDGTRRLLELARRCPRLETAALLSTVYATGLQAGVVREEPADGSAGFGNEYEASKHAAEQLAAGEYADLPLSTLRLATVVADDDEGQVSQHNAFHNTLGLFYFGLLSLVPGDRQAPLYFVTGEFAAAAVAALVDGRHQGTFHLAHEASDSLRLGELVDLAFERFGECADFARRRPLPPLFVDQTSFGLLADGTTSFSGPVVQQALSSVTPFARQLFVTKDLRNDRLRAALPDYRRPDARTVVERACDHLVRTRWGRRAAA